MFGNTYSIDADSNIPDPGSAIPVNSANVSNYSANQASSGLSLMPTQLPALSAGAFSPSFTPGYVNAPFGSPYVIPFSAPELARQYNVSGRYMQPPNLRATDNFSCSMVTIDGLEKGQGCTVKNGSQASVAVDLSGSNPYNFVNGANNINVVGDSQSQMCVVSYTDAFDTASFALQPNGRFQACI